MRPFGGPMATWQGACNGSTYLTTFYY
jgi:hypothetical protein